MSTPGDIYLGNIPTPYGGPNAAAQPSSDVLGRATESAGVMSPISPSYGAGARFGTVTPLADDAWLSGLRGNLTKPIIAPPSAQDVRSAANAGYDAVKQSGLEVPSTSVIDLANTATRAIGKDFTPTDAPSTYARLAAMSDPERSSSSMLDLMSHRDALTGIIGKGGPDGVAARRVRDALDNQLNNPASMGVRPITDPTRPGVPPTMAPEDVGSTLQTARDNYRSALNANRISGDLDPAVTGILERAEGRAATANSGQNLDNQLRRRAAAILEHNKDVASLAPDEKAALEAIRDGTFLQNRLRSIGNTLGGGGGLGRLWSSGMGGAGGLLAGMSGGGTGQGTAAAGAIAAPAIGWLSKTLENALARRSINAADELIRSNSPLYRSILDAAPLSYSPGLGRDEAVMRALMPGLLAPPQPPLSSGRQMPPGFI